MKSASRVVVVLTTTGSRRSASTIAQSLVQRRLAACVNIIPQITSVYRWKNRILQDREFLLIIKSQKKNLHHIQQSILDLHSYQTPEIIVFPLSAIDEKYLKWLELETTTKMR